MLPFLVLLVATSALAAPGAVQLTQVSSNDVRYADNSLIGRAFEVFDDADANILEINIGAILKDLSRQGSNSALANGQAVAVLGELSTGRPGDACAAANYVNAYTRYVASGNSAGLREALGNYIRVITNNVDNIVKLVNNREAVRFASGQRGGCAGEGRSYQFDAAWDIILGQNKQSLIEEEFCVTKRLYCALNAVSNNVGAQITASSLPPSLQIFSLAGPQLKDFLSRVGSKSNVAQSGGSLKQALSSAVGRVTL